MRSYRLVSCLAGTRLSAAAPATAVTLDPGCLYVLYLTGLYQAAERDSVIHAAVHLHMFLAGCLLSWAVIGMDPIRRRPGPRGRLAALFIAAAGQTSWPS